MKPPNLPHPVAGHREHPPRTLTNIQPCSSHGPVPLWTEPLLSLSLAAPPRSWLALQCLFSKAGRRQTLTYSACPADAPPPGHSPPNFPLLFSQQQWVHPSLGTFFLILVALSLVTLCLLHKLILPRTQTPQTCSSPGAQAGQSVPSTAAGALGLLQSYTQHQALGPASHPPASLNSAPILQTFSHPSASAPRIGWDKKTASALASLPPGSPHPIHPPQSVLWESTRPCQGFARTTFFHDNKPDAKEISKNVK